MIFGHRKCSRGTGYISGHGKGCRAPSPAKVWAYWAKRGNAAASMGCCAPLASRIGRGNPIPFFLFFFPLSTPIWPAHMGGAHQPPRGWFVPFLAH